MSNTEVPAEFRRKHGTLLRAIELARLKLQAAQRNFEANPDKDHFRRRVSEAEIKVKEAENKLHEVELEIEECRDKAERTEAEGNALMSGLAEHFGIDFLAELINECGLPAHGQQGTPNDVFWGAAMLKDREILYSPAHGNFYEYNSFTGLWYTVTEDKLATELHSFLVDIDRKTVNNGSLVRWSNLAFRNATVRTQRGYREDRQAFMEQKTRHAQVANGVIEFVGGKPILMPFDPKYKSLFASPIAYNPDAKCPEFEQLIAHLRKDDQSAIQRAAGQFLIGRNLTQRIIIFEGVGNTGKSTLAQIIEVIVGGQACVELRTEHLKGRFEAYRFNQKSLLIGSDVAHDFLLQEGATELKKITGGDLISAEKKGSTEVFHFNGELNVLITSNSRLILRLFSDAGAWRRRLVIIDFPPSGRTAEQNKEDYAKHLLHREGQGILNWALDGAKQLLQDLAEEKGFALTAEQKSRVDNRIDESDSLSLFLKERLRKSDVGSLTTKLILDSYSSFCREHGWGFPGEQTVFRRLNDLMSSLFEAQPTKHIKNAKGGDERGYRGVSLNLTKPLGSTVDSTDDGDSATLPARTFTRFSRNQQERCPDVTLPPMNNSAACGLPLFTKPTCVRGRLS